MTQSPLALVVLLCCSCIATAQVKQQFQDDTYAQTTVVIKEDGSSDQNILDQAFDIDEVGMDEVIRIKVGDAQESNTASTLQASAPINAPIQSLATTTIQTVRLNTARNTEDEVAMAMVDTPEPQRATRTSAPRTSATKSTKRKKNSRARVKKRKNRQLFKANRCYKF